MRAQQQRAAFGIVHLRREIESVVHRARGMRLGNIERGEVAPVVFDLGPRRDPEAHTAEDSGELATQLPAVGHDAAGGGLGGKGSVDPFAGGFYVGRRGWTGRRDGKVVGGTFSSGESAYRRTKKKEIE